MTTTKFLLAYRNLVTDRDEDLSPAELEQMLAQWHAWKARFDHEILDLGDALTSGGRVLRGDGSVTDGPWCEAKEVLGGYSLVQAESLERAVEIARSCPVLQMPGTSVEVRALAGF